MVLHVETGVFDKCHLILNDVNFNYWVKCARLTDWTQRKALFVVMSLVAKCLHEQMSNKG